MDTDGCLFQAKGLGYRYPNGTVALEDISLTIGAGERVAILGANGSGKSTLLKLLDALYFPTQGELWALGRPLSEKAMAEEVFALEFRRRVGLLFQDTDAQLFSPTVWDEVAFGPLHLGLAKSEVVDRVEATLRLLGIAKLAERAPYRLSGGEKKKVALATVLAIDPEILLLDEPTAALDPRSQQQVVDLIAEMGEQGKTIIAATHDLDAVEYIAERVYVLGEDKRLQAQGSPGEILADQELLHATNLLHQHQHRHHDLAHLHPHHHHDLHEHGD